MKNSEKILATNSLQKRAFYLCGDDFMIYDYPFKGKFKVTCSFGRKGAWQCGWHIGTDVVGLDDKTVYAITDGVVESVNAHGKAYGKHVCIKHKDGMVSLYAHLSRVSVKVGQKVCRGELLGIMGATGNATGAHLHLELHEGRYRYPAKGTSPLTEKDLVDAWAWIEDHIGGEDEMQEVQDLQVWSKATGKCTVVKAVNVNGSNYIKLRDMEKLTQVRVSYVDGKVYVD